MSLDQTEMFRKALERLVSAVTSSETPTDESRLAVVDEALTYAQMALGEGAVSDEERDNLVANLETMAIQIIVDKMRRDDLFTFRAMVRFHDEEDEVAIIATSHPTLGTVLNKQIDQLLEEEQHAGPFDVN